MESTSEKQITLTLGRAFWGITLLTLLVMMLQSVVWTALSLILAFAAQPALLTQGGRMTLALAMAGIGLACVGLLGLAMRQARRQLATARVPWPLTMPSWAIVGLVLLLFLAQRGIPVVRTGPLFIAEDFNSLAWVAYVGFVLLTLLTLGGQAWVWTVWFADTTRSRHGLSAALAAWIALQLAWFFLPSLEFAVFAAGAQPLIVASVKYSVLASGTARELAWQIRWEAPGRLRLFGAAQVLVLCVFCGYAAQLIYKTRLRLRAIRSKNKLARS